MADEHIRVPGNQVRAGAPAGRDRPGTNHRPGEGPGGDGEAVEEQAEGVLHEAVLSVRWIVGLVVVLALGWGLVLVVAYLARVHTIPLPELVAAGIAAGFSLVCFLLLETRLRLSRFMGLRVTPRTSPLLEAGLVWLFGPLFVVFRSTTSTQPAPRARPAEQADSFREVVETVVFVIVLVLMLKTFVAEAFVIPTGSMATTLLGYHRSVTCPQCGYTFPVNMSAQVDPQNSTPEVVTGCTCPNCRLHIPFDLQDQGPGNPP
jgi:hypothetical protein